MTTRNIAGRLWRLLRKSPGPAGSGQALTEVTIVLVLFIMLIFGIIDGARLIWDYSVVSNSASEAVRWAAVRGSQSTSPADATAITDFAKSMAVGLVADDITVTPTWIPAGNTDPGSVVPVRVQYNPENRS